MCDLCNQALLNKITHGDRVSVVRATDPAAVVHHVEGLVGDTLGMCGVPLREPPHHHVGITYCLHLEGGREGGSGGGRGGGRGEGGGMERGEGGR